MKGTGNKAQQAFNDVSPDDRPDLMTEAEYETAFKKIENDWFKDRKSSDPKDVFYVTGLPGAGKSTVVKDIIKEHLARGEPAPLVIDFDELRAYHPRYKDYVAEDSVNAAAKVNKSVEHMIDWVFAQTSKRGLDVIVDGSGMGRDITRGIFAPYVAQGYAIKTLVLAVPPAVAQQSVRLRYEETFVAYQNGAAVLPRWVESRQQSKAPENLVDTIRTLIDDGMCRDFTVINRRKDVLFHEPVTTETKHDLLQIIQTENTRNLTADEQMQFDQNAIKIEDLTARRVQKVHPERNPTPKMASKI